MIASATLLLMMAPTAPTAQPAQRAQPVRPLIELISPDDYPVDAVARNAEGRALFQLSVNEKGTPFFCRILESTKEPSLDRVTCDLFMARAKFRPAVDAKGRAVADTYTSAVNWRLSGETADVLPFEPSRTVVAVYFTAGGVSHCDMSYNDVAGPRFNRDQCVESVGQELIEVAEHFRTAATVRAVTTFVPQGREPEKDGRDYGKLGFEATAAVRVAPDGTIARCHMVDFKLSSDFPQVQEKMDYCEAFAPKEPLFAPATDPAEVRSGRFISRLYIDTGPVGEKPPQPPR